MNVEKEIAGLVSMIKAHGDKIRWLRKHQKKLEALPEARMCGLQLDFDNLPHKEIVQVVRELGGKWAKSANRSGGSNEGKVDYVAKIEGFDVRCWAGDPPPSCRIVEVEEVIPEQIIPASVRKVKKMICKPEFAAEIAIAAEKGVQP